MKLQNVDRFFDSTPLRDAYTNANFGVGQLDLFDDSKRDGVTVLRRVLSVVAQWTPPPRGVLSFTGENWLVGLSYPDVFKGQVIRKRFILHRSDGICQFLTGDELLTAGATGLKAHASKAWVKDVKDISTTSDLQSQYVVYAAKSEALAQGMFVRFPDGTTLLARNSYSAVSGFRALECSELEPDALTTVQLTLQRPTYDPVLETYATVAPVAVPAIVTRFLDDYEFRNEKMPDAFIGDLRVRVRAVDAVGVQAGDSIALNSKSWKILSVDPREDSTLSMHVRTAA